MSKVALEFEKTRKALMRLKEVVDMPLDPQETLIDATIQRFEFSIELFWKLLKLILESEGIEARTPKAILQQAYIAHYINDEKSWIDMLEDRNETSHTYNEKLAIEIYNHIKNKYYQMLQNAFDELERTYAKK